MSIPVPSTAVRTYPPRGPMQQFRFAEGVAFQCFRCGGQKKSKLITVHGGDWNRRLCNGCYGRLLSIYDVKAGTSPEDDRADALAHALLTLVDSARQREAEALLRASESRVTALTPEALRFIATAEVVAGGLTSAPHLEWSPAIIGLCKAFEIEVVERMMRPLAMSVGPTNAIAERHDKDLGRVAAFCVDPKGKSPELGAFAHFLSTTIHSTDRRHTSVVMNGFLNLARAWVGSGWILDPKGCCEAIVAITTRFRNPAAHTQELTQGDYLACRDVLIGSEGHLWRLLLATTRK